MKIRNLTFILLAAFVTYSCSNSKKNDLPMQEVSGKVKSIRTTGYKAVEKFGEISEGDVLSGDGLNNIIKFNKEGYITEISNFNNKGDLVKKSIYVFDDDGKIIKINIYDGNGDEIGRTVYTYDSDDRVTKIVDYDKSGKINFTQKLEWEGDKVIKNLFIDDNSVGNYIINEFKGSHLVKSVTFDKDGVKTGEYTEYENDKLTRIVTPEYTISLTYNDKGLCSFIENGQIYITNAYYRLKGASYQYEYEYDEKDNWIRKVEKNNQSKKAERIFIREIEYY